MLLNLIRGAAVIIGSLIVAFVGVVVVEWMSSILHPFPPGVDPMDIEVRLLAVSDIPAVCETQAGAYKDSSIHEPPETFAAYLRAFPAGSFAAVANDSLVGYGIGHPWLKGVPPPLELTELELPTMPTCFHVHDIAVQV